MGLVITPLTLYTPLSRILAVLAWLVCGFFALNLLMTGTVADIWHFLPWLLLVCWLLYLVQWRPRLVIRADSLYVVNMVREHHIPFAALTSLRVGQGVVLQTTAGTIYSWGAPGTGKLGPRLGTTPRTTGTGQQQGSRDARMHIEAACQAWEQGTDCATQSQREVSSRWDLPTAVVSVLLLILAVAATIG